MKHFYFKSIFLSLLMMVTGNVGALAQEPELILDFTTAWTADDETNVFKTTIGETEYQFSGQGSSNFKFNTGYFIFGKKNACIDLPKVDFVVEKIEVIGNSGASADTKMNLFVDDDYVSTETTGCKGTNTYEIAEEYQAANTQYKLIVTSSHNAQITYVKYYKKQSSSGPVNVTGISLDQEALQLKEGKTAQLTATITPGNATVKTVEWSSNNESVATVDADGLVTAVAEGEATITARAKGGENIKATCVVTVAAASVADGYYVKVTSASSNWSGEYLIVYEDGKVALNGALTTLDAANNTIEVEIEDGKIPAYDKVKAAAFTITKIEGGSTYSIKAASGKFIGATSYANSLASSDSEIANSLSLDASGNAVIKVTTSGGDVTLRYNKAVDQARFRYFKSGQQPVLLYKKEDANAATLERIELIGEYPKTFKVGDEFSHEGMTVMAYFSDESSQDVTSDASFEGYDMSAEGEQTVKVSYNYNGSEKTATYGITVEPATTNKYYLVPKDGDPIEFDGLTLTKELSVQTEFTIKDSNDKVYYGSNNNDVNIINAENHENLPTYESGKGFYLSKDNTWVFTLTEGDDGAVTLTVSPETAGETKYMITTDLNTETEDVFDANYQLTKEMTTEPFFIVRSDDYGLFEVTSKDRNEPNGYLWFVFSEDATTAHFEVGKRENMYAVSKADSYTFTLDLENKTVTAVQVKDELYTLVTSVDNLSAGDKVIILNQDAKKAMGAQNNNNRAATAVEFDGSERAVVPSNSSIQVFTLEADTEGEGWYFYTGSGYIYAASKSSNHLKTKAEKDDNAKASITISNNGVASVVFQGANSHNTMQYNSANSLFACYEPESPQQPVYIYKQDDGSLSFNPISVTIDLADIDQFESPVLSNPNNLDITATSTNEDVAVFNTETLKVELKGQTGTAVITVKSVATDGGSTSMASVTVTVTKLITFKKVISTDELVAGKRYVLVNEAAQKVMAAYSSYFTATGATFDGGVVKMLENEANILTLGGVENAWTFATSIEADKYLSLTTAGAYLQPGEDVDAIKWTVTFEEGNAKIQSNNYTDYFIRFNSGSNPQRFNSYKGTQEPVQLYVEVDEDDVDLTITAAGYATLYYSDRALKVPEGVTAKTYKVVDGKLAESKTYEAGKVIPMGEAVVLKGAEGDYTFFASSTAEPKDADNQLKGSDEEEQTTGGNYYYALRPKSKDGKHGPGFYWMNSTGEAFTNGAHKAYLALDKKFGEAQGLAKEFYLFDEATTSISGIDAASADRTEIYNLNGQRVGNGYKGVVIKNGKKILRK